MYLKAWCADIKDTEWMMRRWTFYVLLVWSAAMLLSIIFIVPETYEPVLLRRKAVILRNETGDGRWRAPIEHLDRSIMQTIKRSVYRPFLLLALEPMCLNLCIFSALLLGILYLFFGAFTIVFEDSHGFNLWQAGLTFLGLFVGEIIAIMTEPLWQRNYIRLVESQKDNHGRKEGSEPEFRLPPAITGGLLVPVGLFWYISYSTCR